MSDLSATAPGTSRRTRGTVTVGDYLGVPAADAARAVRRLGLRPGLDRQFGGGPETIGLVLAQDPDAGGGAQRGAMVTLYVSAPTVAVEEPEQEPEQEQGQEPQPRSDAPEAQRSPAATGRATSTRARRKRRERPAAPTRCEPRAQAIPAEGPAPPSVPAAHQRSQGPDSDQAGQSAEHTDPAWDQLPLAMRDVFGSQAPGLSHRSRYPHKPLRLRVRGGWAWLKTHPALALFALVLLALSVSGTLAPGHNANRRTPEATTASAAPARRTRVGSGPRADRAKRSRRRPASGKPLRTARVVAHAAARGRAGAPVVQAGQQSAPASSGIATGEHPPSAGSTGTPAATQSGGGPFSP